MKILVTGANGYLGQGIVKKLLDDGNIVVAVDFVTDNVDNRAIKIDCDLFSVNNPFDFFGKPDVLLHLAWRNGFKHFEESHVLDLPNHFKFLKTMSESNVKQIAVMGTMHEVGFFEGCINENTPCWPSNNYGIAKNALRELTFNICKSKEKTIQWLRGFYIVGNSKFGDSIFSKITTAASEGKESFPFTTGKNQYDFLDYDRFCFQVASVVEQRTIQGIINICSGQPMTLAERVEKFIRDNKYPIKLAYGSFPDRPYDSKAVWGDNTKISLILAEREKNKDHEQ